MQAAKDEMVNTIYYVEDDCHLRDLVVYALQNHGFEALGFSDAHTFFNACQKVLPQLILLDIILPDESGLLILQNFGQKLKPDPFPSCW